MADYLVFTLAATFAAMGDLAGHERRGTLTWPGRSAVLGLVAAALGIRRHEVERLAGLEALRVTVGLYDDGTLLRDYHTVQTVPSAAARRPDSRPDALRRAGRGINTTITLRDYRTGVLYGVALRGDDLALLAAALRRPVFTLCLGRKACPLAFPPAPRIVAAEDAVTALAQAEMPPFRFGRDGKAPMLRRVFSDDALPGAMVERRRDCALDRTAWHFTDRPVHIADLLPPEAAS